MAAPYLAKANSTFSLALFKTLSEKDKTANIFYSPFSISSALAMVLLGARENTAAELSKVLGFSEEEKQMQTRWLHRLWSRGSFFLSGAPAADATADEVHARFGELLSELNKANAPYALIVANRLYGDQSFQFLQEFHADVKKYYRAELESVNFKDNAEGARVKINTWVEEKTRGKIKDLLGQGTLDALTKLVLVNAIYFKAKWAQPFQWDETIDSTFRLNKNNTKPVEMMCQKGTFPYRIIPEVNIKVLEMPYEKGDLSMIILLPEDIEDDSTGLEKLEKELTHQNFVDWTRPDRMKRCEVDLKIPKFKLEETYDLMSVLKEMGLSDAFTLKSDLSGMSPGKDLFLSEAVHKAYVEVNEEGTEAAAATGFGGVRCAYFDLPTFKADHPFLFFIRHNPSQTVLFSGRFCSPSGSLPDWRQRLLQRFNLRYNS